MYKVGCKLRTILWDISQIEILAFITVTFLWCWYNTGIAGLIHDALHNCSASSAAWGGRTLIAVKFDILFTELRFEVIHNSITYLRLPLCLQFWAQVNVSPAHVYKSALNKFQAKGHQFKDDANRFDNVAFRNSCSNNCGLLFSSC